MDRATLDPWGNCEPSCGSILHESEREPLARSLDAVLIHCIGAFTAQRLDVCFTAGRRRFDRLACTFSSPSFPTKARKCLHLTSAFLGDNSTKLPSLQRRQQPLESPR